MFEKHIDPLPPLSTFILRLLLSLLIALVLILVALYIGMLGYHIFEKMSWVDAFVNASMILSGMGPLGTLSTTSGKIFAGCYALFSGLLFISLIGIVLAPIIHRILHKFHSDMRDK